MQLNNLLNVLLGGKTTEVTLKVVKNTKGLNVHITGAGLNVSVEEEKVQVTVAGAEVMVNEGEYVLKFSDGVVSKFEAFAHEPKTMSKLTKAVKPAKQTRGSGSTTSAVNAAAY